MAKFLSVADMSQIVLADSSQICHRAVVHICSISVSLVRDILNSHCYANVFEPQLTKIKSDYCAGRIIFSPNIFKLKLISNRVSLF